MITIKSSLNLLFFVISFLSFSQNTNYEVIYKAKSIINIEEKRIKNPTTTELYESILKELENLQYKLVFNKTESFFEEKASMISDEKKDVYMQELSRAMSFNGKLYTNIKTGLVLHQKTMSSDVFLVESNVKDIKWNLTAETKKIDTYTCYKATTVTTIETIRGPKEWLVTAWYAPNIPFSFGPTSYAGLPGLILEVEVNKLVFYAIKIELNKQTETDVKIPTKGKRITEKEFQDIQKKGFSQYKRN